MSSPAPGDMIGGKYEAIGVLGSGGMGIVLEAVHVGLGQHFAVKVMRPEYANDREATVRFQNEARAAGQLRSPHAVRIFDVDKGLDGVPYIVMELLEGHDLATEMRERKTLPVAEVVDWVVQACAAVGEAHALGVVHRDLKPANIFLCMEGGSRIAKVVDFGISKLTTVQSVTGEGTNVGTPHYMSPEQLRGSKGIDGRADIWSLGVLLYRVLAGRFPIDAETPSGLAIAIATVPPAGLDVFRPDLPPQLVAAIMRTLSKEPGDRFATAQDLANAIAEFGTGRAPLPPRTSARRSGPTTLPLAELLASTRNTPVTVSETVPAAPDPAAKSPAPSSASQRASTIIGEARYPEVPTAPLAEETKAPVTAGPPTGRVAAHRRWIPAVALAAVAGLMVGLTLLRSSGTSGTTLETSRATSGQDEKTVAVSSPDGAVVTVLSVPSVVPSSSPSGTVSAASTTSARLAASHPGHRAELRPGTTTVPREPTATAPGDDAAPPLHL